jgi:hypothetical protein
VRELTDLEFEIIMILADNKGHALWELVKLLGKEKSNLIKILDRLEDEIDLSYFNKISYHDLIDIDSLALKLYEPKDLLSTYIRDGFSPDILRLLDLDINNFDLYCDSELDKLLNDPHLFEEKRFSHVALNQKIQEVIREKPQGKDLRCLNRLLLEEAYPECIARGQAPIIYRGTSRRTTNTNSKQPKHHEIPYFINQNILVLKYILNNIKLIGIRSFRKLCRKQQDQLENLKEKFEWQIISNEEYQELKDKIKFELYSDEDEDDAQKNTMRIEKMISSQYALEFVRRFGFRWTVYRIHGMVGGWDTCWPLGESAIKSGIINDEADLECAKKLVQYHLDVEEGFRRLDEEDDGKI